jgi:hypothetical protein
MTIEDAIEELRQAAAAARTNFFAQDGQGGDIILNHDAVELVAYEIKRLYKPLTTDLPKLSARQAEAYNYIVNFIQKHGFSPRVRDIQLGIRHRSPSTTHDLVDILQRKGYIKRNGSRGIVVIGKEGGNE